MDRLYVFITDNSVYHVTHMQLGQGQGSFQSGVCKLFLGPTRGTSQSQRGREVGFIQINKIKHWPPADLLGR